MIKNPSNPSFVKLPQVFFDSIKFGILTPTDVIVAAKIISYKKCWARKSILAKELGMSEVTIHRSIQALKKLPFYRQERRPNRTYIWFEFEKSELSNMTVHKENDAHAELSSMKEATITDDSWQLSNMIVAMNKTKLSKIELNKNKLIKEGKTKIENSEKSTESTTPVNRVGFVIESFKIIQNTYRQICLDLWEVKTPPMIDNQLEWLLRKTNCDANMCKVIINASARTAYKPTDAFPIRSIFNFSGYKKITWDKIWDYALANYPDRITADDIKKISAR